MHNTRQSGWRGPCTCVETSIQIVQYGADGLARRVGKYTDTYSTASVGSSTGVLTMDKSQLTWKNGTQPQSRTISTVVIV